MRNFLELQWAKLFPPNTLLTQKWPLKQTSTTFHNIWFIYIHRGAHLEQNNRNQHLLPWLTATLYSSYKKINAKTRTVQCKTWSKFKSVWTSLMGFNRNSSVQLTTQIFGVRSDTWHFSFKQHASHRLWKTGRGENPLSQGGTSVEMYLNITL